MVEDRKKTIEHLRNKVWNACHLMRRAGLNQLEYIEQFTYLLYLKLLDDKEKDEEAICELEGKKYKTRLGDNKYRFYNWVQNEPNKVLFLTNLFRYLEDIPDHHGFDNSGIRRIFRNARLLIKDNATITRVLEIVKGINLEEYDFDVKGAVYEFLLSKLNEKDAGMLGQYFTPRHIIDMMIMLVNPNINEKIYDPACGTGGFLVRSFLFVRDKLKSKYPDDEEKWKFLKEEAITGREFNELTTKLCIMNMMLHGDGHRNIMNADSLTWAANQEQEHNKYDVVLTNPPFGSSAVPTDELYKFPIRNRNPENLFLQHVFLSLNKTGRCGIVIPEGILFRGGADKKVRQKILSEANLLAVISLPPGVFRPYAKGNKTSILIFKKGEKTENVWFYDVRADGYELNSDLRRPVEENDLPDLIQRWPYYNEEQIITKGRKKYVILTDHIKNIFENYAKDRLIKINGKWCAELLKSESHKSWFATIKQIEEKDYNLTAKRYKPVPDKETTFVSFSEILEPVKDKITMKDSKEYKQVTVKLYGKGAVLRRKVLGKSIKTKTQYVAREGYLIVSKIDARNGAFAIIPKELDGAIVSSDFPLFKVNQKKVNLKYFEYCITKGPYGQIISQYAQGTTNRVRVKPDDILDLTIPLPPKEIQEQIVERLDKQKSIIENTTKTIEALEEGLVDESDFEGDWEWKKIDDVIVLSQYGLTKSVKKNVEDGVYFVRITDIDKTGKILKDTLPKISVSKEELRRYKLEQGDVIIARTGSIGLCALYENKDFEAVFASYLIRFRFKDEILPKYALFFLLSSKGQNELKKKSRKMAQTNINAQEIKSIKIPVPPLDVQKEIVARVEERQKVLEGLRKVREEAERTMQNIINGLFKDVEG